MIAEEVLAMKKRFVRADASSAWSVCRRSKVDNGVAVRCDGTVVDITQQEPLRRNSVAARRIAIKRRRSVTPAASGGRYPAEDWVGRMTAWPGIRSQ